MVKLKVSAANTPGSGIKVNVSNPSKSLAFNVVLKVFNKANGLEILPVLWDDNYFELLPGESKTVTALYEAGQLQNVQAAIEFGGWNVIKQTLALSAGPEKQPKSVAHKP